MMWLSHAIICWHGAVAIAQPKSGFRVGTDTVFLAAAIGVNRGRILDLGAGVGGVSLCLPLV